MFQELKKAITTVLNSDEDMAQMYLTTVAETGRHRRVDQHQEVEMLFENYLMQVRKRALRVSLVAMYARCLYAAPSHPVGISSGPRWQTISRSASGGRDALRELPHAGP
jgi:hypothetical protein